jgi:succinyl-CoA synthetase alpha subunit
VGVGDDPITGLSFVDILKLFSRDPQTEAVVLIGEIGGASEEEAADYIHSRFGKPVVAFIAGQNAPPGRRMGHAGAVVSGDRGSAKGKMAALKAAGATVVENPAEMGLAMLRRLKERRES